MGEEPNRVAPAPAPEDPSQQDLRKLEREIAASRDRLTDMVAELDRRRHHLLSVREHPLRIAGVAGAAAILAAGATFLLIRRRGRATALRKRARNFSEAFSRMIAHPERVASDAKSPLWRIAVLVVPILVKKIADRTFRRKR